MQIQFVVFCFKFICHISLSHSSVDIHGDILLSVLTNAFVDHTGFVYVLQFHVFYFFLLFHEAKSLRHKIDMF